MRVRFLSLIGAAAALSAVAADAPPPAWQAAGAGNPLLPGYFADPSIVRDRGKWYVFATIDPWGGDRLARWESANGRDWTFSTPEWPTKAAATSPTSGDAKVWAPSVVKTRDGRWFLYVSVGSEIWVGTAPSPAGPWRDANGGRPLIARDFDSRYHMIDAEAFIDADGQAYLYWGSGLNWVNGHCFVVKLKPDMVTFDGSPRDVTPAHYFEAPFMIRRGARYLLMYSDGNTTTDTYKVRYAVGASPLDPFREAADSPVLATDAARDVFSPGHHAVFSSGGRDYILHHRQALPFARGAELVLRQVSVDPLAVRADGTIARVAPSWDGAVAGFAAHRARGLRWRAIGRGADALHAPDRAADDNYATLWRPAKDGAAELVADLGRVLPLRESRLRPEYPTRGYRVALDASDDGRAWRPLAAEGARQGSPIILPHATRARYLRLRFDRRDDPALWEWSIF